MKPTSLPILFSIQLGSESPMMCSAKAWEATFSLVRIMIFREGSTVISPAIIEMEISAAHENDLERAHDFLYVLCLGWYVYGECCMAHSFEVIDVPKPPAKKTFYNTVGHKTTRSTKRLEARMRADALFHHLTFTFS